MKITIDRNQDSMPQLQDLAMLNHTLQFEVSLEDFIFIEFNYAGKIGVEHTSPVEAVLSAGPFKITWRRSYEQKE